MVALSPGDAAGEGDEDPPARTGTGSERFRVEQVAWAGVDPQVARGYRAVLMSAA